MSDAAVPSTEQVQSYLAQHSLEAVIEDAVNEAVLRLAKDPFEFIGNKLLQKSAQLAGEDGKGGRKASTKVAVVVPDSSEGGGAAAGGGGTGEELKREYKVSDVKISEKLSAMLKAFFDKMDGNKDGTVTKDEAIAFWGKNFAKVNAKSMFNEVDENGDEAISWDEFYAFWQNVVGSGYDEEELCEEVEMMLEGGSWVDFDDGRTT